MPYNNVNNLNTLVSKAQIIATLNTANFDGGLITTDIIKIAEITHIEKTIGWFVKFEMLNDIQYQTTGTGVMQNIDDFSTAVSPKQFDLIKQDCFRKATLFLQDMLDFMTDDNNLSDYPTYKNSVDKDEDAMGDVTANKMGGIIFY